jgi:hypothetical protein
MKNSDNKNASTEAANETVTADVNAVNEAVTADVNAVNEAVTADVNAVNEAVTADANKANETVTADANNVLIRFLLSPCGAFLLPWNVGDEVEINVNQAQEMVEAKYAEYVN